MSPKLIIGHQPKQCTITGKILQMYHTFALFDYPKMGNLMTPAKKGPKKGFQSPKVYTPSEDSRKCSKKPLQIHSFSARSCPTVPDMARVPPPREATKSFTRFRAKKFWHAICTQKTLKRDSKFWMKSQQKTKTCVSRSSNWKSSTPDFFLHMVFDVFILIYA